MCSTNNPRTSTIEAYETVANLRRADLPDTPGSGAFLPDLGRALELTQTMIRLGAAADCRVVALVTAMDRPLGHAVGNALETEESILALRGEGPPDLRELTLALVAEMAAAARGEVVYFSRDPNNHVLKAHLAEDGQGAAAHSDGGHTMAAVPGEFAVSLREQIRRGAA